MDKELQFISPLYDSSFKRLWKNNDCRKWLTKLVYLITNINLDEYQQYDQEITTGNDYMDYRLDIVFIKDKGEKTVNIELYKDYREEDTFKSRAYVFRILDYAYSKDKKYKKKYAYRINFNDGKFKYNKDVDILRCQIRDNMYDFDDLLIYDVFLSNYKNICYNGSNELEVMLSLLSANSYDEMERIANGNREAMYIVEELKNMALEEEFGLAYNVEQEQRKRERTSRYYGYEEGKEIGKEEKD